MRGFREKSTKAAGNDARIRAVSCDPPPLCGKIRRNRTFSREFRANAGNRREIAEDSRESCTNKRPLFAIRGISCGLLSVSAGSWPRKLRKSRLKSRKCCQFRGGFGEVVGKL